MCSVSCRLKDHLWAEHLFEAFSLAAAKGQAKLQGAGLVSRTEAMRGARFRTGGKRGLGQGFVSAGEDAGRLARETKTAANDRGPRYAAGLAKHCRRRLAQENRPTRNRRGRPRREGLEREEGKRSTEAE